MKVGDSVVIKECHSIPELVGKEGKIILKVTVELDASFAQESSVSFKYYPVQVWLTEPVEVPGMPGAFMRGPFPFREDELELKALPPIPKAFEQM